MSTLSISIPESVRSRIEFFAGEDGVSVEHFVATILAQRVAVADADSYIRSRAVLGSKERLLELLTAAPDVPPDPRDQIMPMPKNG
jgi:hypothetical protein